MKKMYSIINNRKGFTLIELIVVIAILGILASIAVPRFTGTRDKANQAVDNQTAALLKNSVALYRADKGAFPTNNSAQMKEAVEAVLESIPAPKVSSNKYYYNATTGDVVAASAAPTDYVELDAVPGT